MKTLFAPVVLAIFCVHCLTTVLAAQDAAQGSPQPRAHAFVINPVFAPMGTVHAEYELATGYSGLTVGVGTWLEYKEIQDTWYHVKLMYYPSATLFKGLGFGVTAGLHHSYSSDAGKRGHESAPVAGGIVQYNWLPGEGDRFLLGVGFGAEIPLKARDNASPLPAMNGNVRLLAGILL